MVPAGRSPIVGRADLSDPHGVIPAMSYRWGPEARTVLDPDLRGMVRVLGGPGTGKSSLLIDVAATRIHAGADPGSVLLLTGSGRISAQARSALTAKLLGPHNIGGRPAVIREPLVRSVHSYAFAVLRLGWQSARGGWRRSAPEGRRPGWSPAPNRMRSSPTCWPARSPTVPMRRRRGRPSCERHWVLPVSPPNYVSC